MNRSSSTPFYYHDFKKISFLSWTRILQDVIDYHMISADLSWVQDLQQIYQEVKIYIEKNGILPDAIKEATLNENIAFLTAQKEELLSLGNQTSMSHSKIKSLDKEIQNYQEELAFYQKYIKNNRFVYQHNKSGNQYYDKRKKSLHIQSHMLLDLLDDISFSEKNTLRKLDAIAARVKKEVGFENFDMMALYWYTQPYLDLIMHSDDYGYHFLMTNLYSDY